MVKKGLLLAGMFLSISACVITSPAELFSPTPTICVDCLQATLCAEDTTGDACAINASATQVDVAPTIFMSTDELEPTDVVTEVAIPTEPLVELVVATATEEIPVRLPSVTVNATGVKPSGTPIPGKTEIPSKTPTNTVEPSVTPTTTYTARPGEWIYKLQTGSPKYSKNFAHPESACTWSGVAGQVFGKGGKPQSDIVVVVSGDANGTPIDLLGFTGSAVSYGAGAFEVELPTGPVKTTDSMLIQLFDLEGKELTQAIPFDTFSECNKNLVVLNFMLVK